MFAIDGGRDIDVPEPHLRQAARQLHLVGEPRGPRRLERLRGRLPRPRQHRADRPLAPAAGLAARAVGRHRLDGLLRADAWRRSRAILNDRGRPATDLVLKFLEHFALISDALESQGLWDEEDGFFYDRLRLPDGRPSPDQGALDRRRAAAARRGRGRRGASIERAETVEQARGRAARRRAHPIRGGRRGEPAALLLGVVGVAARAPAARRGSSTRRSSSRRTGCARSRAATPSIRSRSTSTGLQSTIDYEPAESTTGMFGGNSNWRGPIWMPVNYLVIEALQRYARFFGDELKVEYPTGLGARADARRDRRRPARPADLALPRRRRRPPALLRLGRPAPERPAWRDNISSTSTSTATTAPGSARRHQTGWTGTRGRADPACATACRCRRSAS